MFTIGGTNVARQTKMPKPPTADLIKFKPPTTDARASPSAPPIIGMKLLETNLAALIPMLSVLAAIEVCREKRPMKIVTMNIKANIVIFLHNDEFKAYFLDFLVSSLCNFSQQMMG